MKSSLVRGLVSLLAPFAALSMVGIAALSACSKQSEGQRCDRRFDNNTAVETDCATGLSCRTAADLGGTIAGCDVGDLSCGVCCPPSGGTGSCAGQSSTDGGVNMGIPDAGIPDTGPAPDASMGTDASLPPKDSATDAAPDATMATPDAAPDATLDASSSDAGSDADAQ
jgi:hypothetical protein